MIIKRQPFYKCKYDDEDVKHIINSKHYKNFVIKIIRKYYKNYINNRIITLEDLVQVGNMAMIKAIKTFDFTCKRNMSTHIFEIVTTYIRYYIRDNYYLYGFPQRTKINSIKNICNENVVLSVEKSHELESFTLDKNLYKYHVNKNTEELNKHYKIEIFYKALKKMNNYENEIIKMRFLNYNILSQHEMAKFLKVSRTKYLNDIEKPMLLKFKKIYEEIENE